MKKTRRVLSLIIALLMVMSSLVFGVSAQETAESTFVLDEHVTVKVQASGSDFYFTPEEYGWYFFSSISEERTQAKIFDEEDSLIAVSGYSDNGLDFEVLAELEAGKRYRIEIGFYGQFDTDRTDMKILTKKIAYPVSSKIITYPSSLEAIRGDEWGSCDFSEIQILYTLSDGSVYLWNCADYTDVNGILVEFTDEISEDGTKYIVTYECAGVETAFEFTIVDGPIESLEYIGDPVVCYEGKNGSFEVDEKGEKYFAYDWEYPENQDFIINYTDGTSVKYSELEESEDVFYWWEDMQWEDHWEVGENKVLIHFSGVTCDVPAYVKENPVERIEYIGESVTLYYEYEGYVNTDENGEEYFEYYWKWPENPEFMIYYKDGTCEKHSESKALSGYRPEYTENQDEKHWVLGENKIKLEFFDAESYIPVYIIESPVESIEVAKAPLKLSYDENFYPFADGAEVKVTFKDGREEVAVFTPENIIYKADDFGYLTQVVDMGGYEVALCCNIDRETLDYYYTFECLGKVLAYDGYEFVCKIDHLEDAGLEKYSEEEIVVKLIDINNDKLTVAFTDFRITESDDDYACGYAFSEEGIADILLEYKLGYIWMFEFPLFFREGVLTGDADENGAVNVKDATAIQKHIAGLITLSRVGQFCADADGNETINIKDATAIQKSIAGIEM